MTEVAADDNLPDMPPVPRRAGRGASSPSGAGTVVVGIVAAGLLAAVGAMAWRPARFSGALNDLVDERPSVQEQARKALLGMKDYAAPRLPGLLASPAAPQRLRAVRAAKYLGLKEDHALTALVKQKAAADPDPSVQAEALSCLSQFANDGSAESLTALLDLVDKAPPASLPALAGVLGQTEPSGDAGRQVFLDRASKALGSTPHPDAGIRAAYLKGLQGPMIGWLGSPEAAPSEQALKALHLALLRAVDGDPAVRMAADRILSQIPRKPQDKRLPLALDSLTHEDPWVRLWAEATLRDLTGRSAGYDPFAPEADRKAAADRWRTVAKER